MFFIWQNHRKQTQRRRGQRYHLVFSLSLIYRVQYSVSLNMSRLSPGTRQFPDRVFQQPWNILFQNLIQFFVVDVTAAMSCFLSNPWFPQLLPSPSLLSKGSFSPIRTAMRYSPHELMVLWVYGSGQLGFDFCENTEQLIIYFILNSHFQLAVY